MGTGAGSKKRRREGSGGSLRSAAPRVAFHTLAERVRPHVEARLKAAWERKRRRVSKLGPDTTAILEAARDLTLRGGKRYRAVLLAAAYEGIAPRAPEGVAYDAGAALELIQSYLLIQDDWMDGDNTRRGGPAVHVAIADALKRPDVGPACAVLVSDFAWGLAVETLTQVNVSSARRLGALAELVAVHEDVVLGQQLDMIGRTQDVSVVHELKTASYTVRGPLLIGAALAGASSDAKKALERFAKPLGLAFQLRDDLMGTFATVAEAGRPAGSDLRQGKRTALVAAAEGLLDARGKRAFKRAFGKPDASNEAVREAAAALERCGARAAVTNKLWALCDRAETLAASLPVSAKSRLALAGAAAVLRPLPGEAKTAERSQAPSPSGAKRPSKKAGKKPPSKGARGRVNT